MEYNCLYTHQKTKKAKTWKDGVVVITGSTMDNRILKLYPMDDHSIKRAPNPIETYKLPPYVPTDVLNEELELEKHLVQITERYILPVPVPITSITTVPSVSSNPSSFSSSLSTLPSSTALPLSSSSLPGPSVLPPSVSGEGPRVTIGIQPKRRPGLGLRKVGAGPTVSIPSSCNYEPIPQHTSSSESVQKSTSTTNLNQYPPTIHPSLPPPPPVTTGTSFRAPRTVDQPPVVPLPPSSSTVQPVLSTSLSTTPILSHTSTGTKPSSSYTQSTNDPEDTMKELEVLDNWFMKADVPKNGTLSTLPLPLSSTMLLEMTTSTVPETKGPNYKASNSSTKPNYSIWDEFLEDDNVAEDTDSNNIPDALSIPNAYQPSISNPYGNSTKSTSIVPSITNQSSSTFSSQKFMVSSLSSSSASSSFTHSTIPPSSSLLVSQPVAKSVPSTFPTVPSQASSTHISSSVLLPQTHQPSHSTPSISSVPIPFSTMSNAMRAPTVLSFPPPHTCLPKLPFVFVCRTCQQSFPFSSSCFQSSPSLPSKSLFSKPKYVTSPSSSTAYQCSTCYWTRTTVPDTYSSSDHYTEIMTSTLIEEIHRSWYDTAVKYWKFRMDNNGHNNNNKSSLSSSPMYASSTLTVQPLLRQQGVPFYGAVDLIQLKNSGSNDTTGSRTTDKKRKSFTKSKTFRKRNSRSKGNDDDEESIEDEDNGGNETAITTATPQTASSSSSAAATGSKAHNVSTLAQALSVIESGTGDILIPTDPHPNTEISITSPARIITTAHPRWLLKFRPQDREPSSVYNMDDIWLVGTDMNFGYVSPSLHSTSSPSSSNPLTIIPSLANEGTKGRTDNDYGYNKKSNHNAKSDRDDFFRSTMPTTSFYFFARAAWQNLSSSNMMELLPILTLPHHLPSDQTWPLLFGNTSRSLRVCAIRGPNCGSEMAALAILHGIQKLPMLVPLLPSLLYKAASATPSSSAYPLNSNSSSTFPLPVSLSRSRLVSLANEYIATYKLNPNQADTLQRCIQWFRATDDDALAIKTHDNSRIVLVHGVFGSGKSRTIVILLRFLNAILTEHEQGQSTNGKFPGAVGSKEIEKISSSLSLPPTTTSLSSKTPPSMSTLWDDDTEENEDGTDENGTIDELEREETNNTSFEFDNEADYPEELSRPIPPSLSSSSSVGPRIRILLAAATNTAVDRVLCDFLDSAASCTASPVSFTRVGSTRKINPSLLPYTLPSSLRNEAVTNMVKEIQSLSSTATNSSSSSFIHHDPPSSSLLPSSLQSTLDILSNPKVRKTHFEHLLQSRIVGVTTAACNFSILHEFGTFPIVILDESSQIIEPVSLLPGTLFRSECLLTVGDPQQLPPVLRNNPVVVSRQSTASSTYTLESSTLFERLARNRYPLLPLYIQYRCHPVLSQLASVLFYENKLHDGITAGQRGPRLRFVPPLVMYDYSNWEPSTGNFPNSTRSSLPTRILGSRVNPDSTMTERSFTNNNAFDKSLYNEYEANTVRSLVMEMIQRNIPGKDIGIICLYAAQAQYLRNQFHHLESTVNTIKDIQISTVDAFQGAEKSIVIVTTSRTNDTTVLPPPPPTNNHNSTNDNNNYNNTVFNHINNPRRLCVTLTRAKNHLFIVGHLRTLLRSGSSNDSSNTTTSSSSNVWASITQTALSLPGHGVRRTTVQPLLQGIGPGSTNP